MPDRAWDTNIQRRRLRGELRRAREQADLTQQRVASEMDWSASKLIRIEAGTVHISVTDLRALLEFYQITDRDRVQSLVEMARNSRRRSWLHDYRELGSQNFISYLGYEASASTIRNFQPALVPGLLQTEDYADEILRIIRGPKNPQYLETVVRLRLERQDRIFDRTDPPDLQFLLDESVIRRMVGGPDVMLPQLGHLKSVAERPNVTIRVVPFDHGFYRSLRVPYVILEFPDPGDQNVLFLEYPEGEEIIYDDMADGEESPTSPPTYLEIFGELESITSAEESSRLIEDAIRTASALPRRPRGSQLDEESQEVAME